MVGHEKKPAVIQNHTVHNLGAEINSCSGRLARCSTIVAEDTEKSSKRHERSLVTPSSPDEMYSGDTNLIRVGHNGVHIKPLGLIIYHQLSTSQCQLSEQI